MSTRIGIAQTRYASKYKLAECREPPLTSLVDRWRRVRTLLLLRKRCQRSRRLHVCRTVDHEWGLVCQDFICRAGDLSTWLLVSCGSLQSQRLHRREQPPWCFHVPCPRNRHHTWLFDLGVPLLLDAARSGWGVSRPRSEITVLLLPVVTSRKPVEAPSRFSPDELPQSSRR